jgi:hypothetical protein
MNLALIEGLLDGLGATCAARMDPAPGRCCVLVTDQDQATGQAASKTNHG